MDDTNALISIIIPVYKVEKYLNTCIESVLNQTYPNLEIILVDDGSPDQCGKICDSYLSYHNDQRQIKVIHKKNGGLSSARNAGIEQAHGQFLSFIDSDDYWDPNMISQLYLSMQESNADLSMCNLSYIDEDGNKIPSQDAYPEYHLPNIIWNPDDFWNYYNHHKKIPLTIASNKLYRRKLFSQLRYPNGKIREDEFILHHLIARCNKISCINNKLYYYRQHIGSIMSDKYNIKQLDLIDAYIDRINLFIIQNKFKFAGATIVNAIAFLEWFHYGANFDNQTESEYYQTLKLQIRQKSKQLLRENISFFTKCILFLYWINLFPYKLIRNIYKFIEKFI